MKQSKHLSLSLFLTGALLITATAWAKGGKDTRTGKTASISFSHETQVGSAMFQPGDYTVRYRADGAEHFMIFQRTEESYDSGESYNVGKPQRVECQIKPLGAKVSDTTVSFSPEGNTDRLTKLEIAGEDVEHLF